MATLKEIAIRAGVTDMTVSRVLNGSYKATRPKAVEQAKRISRIASDLGYMPNAAARSVASGRFNCACLLSSTSGHRSTLFPGLLRGAHDALAEHDMHLTLAHVDDRKLSDETFLPKALRQWMADGLLINYTQEIPDVLVQRISRQRIPSVWLNSRQEADSVYFDDQAAGRTLTEKLLALGHRRIAFVHYGVVRHYSIAARRAGYEAAMTQAGLTPLSIQREFDKPTLDSAGESTVPLSVSWLSGPDRPTAAVTYSLAEATTTWLAAQHLGLRVPVDLSLATFADSIDEGMGQRITRMWTSHGEMGREAVEMLTEKINRPADRLLPRVLALKWWEGATCGPCRS